MTNLQPPPPSRALLLPVVRGRKTGRRGRSLHVSRAGHRVEAGQDSQVGAGARGLVEGRPDQVVEDLPPELEVVVTVFLGRANPRTPGCVKADEPRLGCSYQDIVKLRHREQRTENREHTNKVNDLDLISVISKSRQVGVGGRSHHVVDKWNMTGYVLVEIKSEFAFKISVKVEIKVCLIRQFQFLGGPVREVGVEESLVASIK